MAEDIWTEKPKSTTVYIRSAEGDGREPSEYYAKQTMDAWLDKVGRFIGNLENDIADLKETERNWLEQEKAYLSCIDELREKAEKWDQYAIYDNDEEEEILVKDLITAYEKLEVIKTWYYKNKPDLYALLTKRVWSELEGILEKSI